MKKLLSGISLIFSGIILFGIAYIPSSNYLIKLGEWSTPPGKLITAIMGTGGLLPFVTSICLFIFGIIFLLWGTFEK